MDALARALANSATSSKTRAASTGPPVAPLAARALRADGRTDASTSLSRANIAARRPARRAPGRLPRNRLPRPCARADPSESWASSPISSKAHAASTVQPLLEGPRGAAEPRTLPSGRMTHASESLSSSAISSKTWAARSALWGKPRAPCRPSWQADVALHAASRASASELLRTRPPALGRPARSLPAGRHQLSCGRATSTSWRILPAA